MMRINFSIINQAATPVLPAILRRLLPDGKVMGREYISCNPTRTDRRPGSFKINLNNGRWADFATGDTGGDIVSLVAYLEGKSQGDAARLLSTMLGLKSGWRA